MEVFLVYDSAQPKESCVRGAFKSLEDAQAFMSEIALEPPKMSRIRHSHGDKPWEYQQRQVWVNKIEVK